MQQDGKATALDAAQRKQQIDTAQAPVQPVLQRGNRKSLPGAGRIPAAGAARADGSTGGPLQWPSLPRRNCPHAPQPIPSGHRQGSPRRRRNRQPPADAARRHDPPPRLRPVHLVSAGPARAAQGGNHRARGNGSRRRDRNADADRSSRGSCGKKPAAGQKFGPPAAEDQGPQGSRSSATPPPPRKWSPTSPATS